MVKAIIGSQHVMNMVIMKDKRDGNFRSTNLEEQDLFIQFNVATKDSIYKGDFVDHSN
jgi:hypothetical protein